MSKIKEAITALTAGENPVAVRVQRKESNSMTDWQFEMALKCAVKISVVAAVTVLILLADIAKLLAVLAFVLFFCFVYLGMKD